MLPDTWLVSQKFSKRVPEWLHCVTSSSSCDPCPFQTWSNGLVQPTEFSYQLFWILGCQKTLVSLAFSLVHFHWKSRQKWSHHSHIGSNLLHRNSSLHRTQCLGNWCLDHWLWWVYVPQLQMIHSGKFDLVTKCFFGWGMSIIPRQWSSLPSSRNPCFLYGRRFLKWVLVKIKPFRPFSYRNPFLITVYIQ